MKNAPAAYTDEELAESIHLSELTRTELGVLTIALDRHSDWSPEVACYYVKMARTYAGDLGLLALVSIMFTPAAHAHPGVAGSLLDGPLRDESDPLAKRLAELLASIEAASKDLRPRPKLVGANGPR